MRSAFIKDQDGKQLHQIRSWKIRTDRKIRETNSVSFEYRCLLVSLFNERLDYLSLHSYYD